jgi:hypothetical protein
MAGQIRNVSISTKTDASDSSLVGIILQTDGDTAFFADPSLSGGGAAGIVLGGGLAPIGAPAHGSVAPASVGSNDAIGADGSGIVYTGTYIYGIALSDPATQNPATVAATGYVTNQTMAYNGDAIYGARGYSWTITNLGTVKSTGYAADGVHLTAGGVVTNGQSDSTTALIGGPGNGVDISGSSGTVTNFGTIQSGSYGVRLAAGGTVTNAQGGWIQGDYPAAVALWGGGTVTNFGTIYGTYWDGVELGPGGSVTNFGTIYGPHAGVAYIGTLAGTVTNAGAIIGGSSGTAVQFGGGDDLLVVDPGAVFLGRVDGALFVGKVDGGGGNNTLELAPGAGPGLLSGLGTSFVNFASVVFDPGAAWTVTLDDPAAFTGTISGFASGDIIDLTGRAATNVTYSSGVLTVLNGDATVATLNLAGSYTSADFSLRPDGLGGPETGIAATGPPAIAAPSSATGAPDAAVALFGQFIAAGFQAAADSSGLGTDITYQPQQTASLLAAPLHH